MKRKYVAIGSCYYGIGHSVREALKFAKRNRPHFIASKDKPIVWLLPEGATTVHISDMGRVTWDGVKGEAIKIDY